MMADDEELEARFFAESIPALADGAAERPCVELSVSESHHAMHVLRLRAGDAVELFDGRGQTAVGRILQAKHGVVSVELTKVAALGPRPGPVVHLAFAVPKGKRLDWLLEKATELGAASLRPVIFERSVAGGEELGENKRQRWLGHCISAAKQSGLNYLPEILDPLDVGQLLAQIAIEGRSQHCPPLVVVGDNGPGAQGLAAVLSKRLTDQAVLVVVGPEGGLTQGEREMMAQAGVLAGRLGQTILRVETAAVALLAATVAILE